AETPPQRAAEMTRHLPPSRVETRPVRARRRDRGICVDQDDGCQHGAAPPAGALPPLVWASAFETGNAKLDGEHRCCLLTRSDSLPSAATPTRAPVAGKRWRS